MLTLLLHPKIINVNHNDIANDKVIVVCSIGQNYKKVPIKHMSGKLTALAQMAACLLLVRQVQGSNPGGVVNFHLKIFNLGARRAEDVYFLIARLYITGLD